MTPYAESLSVPHAVFDKRTREQAIAFLDDNASTMWKMSREQLSVHADKIVIDGGCDE